MKFKFKYALIVLSMVVLSCGSDDDGSSGSSGNGNDFEGSATATYTLTFETLFSQSDFPEDYPDNASFGPVVAIVHAPSINVFQSGSVASDGIADYIDTGNLDTLTAVLEAQQGNNEGLFVIQTAGDLNAVGATSFDVTFTPARTRVTLLANLNPSPDWFVGASSLDIVDGDTLKEEIQQGLVLLDAGTRAGETYETSITLENNVIGVCTDVPYAGDGPFVQGVANIILTRN